MGEIEVSKTLSQDAQVRRVQEIERAWRENQPLEGNDVTLHPGYKTHILDRSHKIQYNKLTVNSGGDVEAMPHRPLRTGKPYMFHGLEGVAAEALEDIHDQ